MKRKTVVILVFVTLLTVVNLIFSPQFIHETNLKLLEKKYIDDPSTYNSEKLRKEQDRIREIRERHSLFVKRLIIFDCVAVLALLTYWLVTSIKATKSRSLTG